MWTRLIDRKSRLSSRIESVHMPATSRPTLPRRRSRIWTYAPSRIGIPTTTPRTHNTITTSRVRTVAPGTWRGSVWFVGRTVGDLVGWQPGGARQGVVGAAAAPKAPWG